MLSLHIFGSISLESRQSPFRVFILHSESGEEYSCRRLILACGTKAKRLDIQCDAPEVINNVFSEVFPILQVKDKHIAIVGAGDAAFDYAMSLSGKNKVTILYHGSRRNCHPRLWQTTSSIPAILYKENIVIEGVPRFPVSRLILRCRQKGELIDLEADYLLTAIGREPDMDLFSPDLCARQEELVRDGRLFLVGDIHQVFSDKPLSLLVMESRQLCEY